MLFIAGLLEDTYSWHMLVFFQPKNLCLKTSSSETIDVITQEVCSLWRLKWTVPCVCMCQLTGQPPPPLPPQPIIWCHLPAFSVPYTLSSPPSPAPPQTSYVIPSYHIEVSNSPPPAPGMSHSCLFCTRHITYYMLQGILHITCYKAYYIIHT